MKDWLESNTSFGELIFIYSKDLYLKFNKRNKEGDTLNNGILLINDIKLKIPNTKYALHDNENSKDAVILLKMICEKCNLITSSDIQKIINAKEDVDLEKTKVQGVYKTFENYMFNPKIESFVDELTDDEYIKENLLEYENLKTLSKELKKCIKEQKPLNGISWGETLQILGKFNVFAKNCKESLYEGYKSEIKEIDDEEEEKFFGFDSKAKIVGKRFNDSVIIDYDDNGIFVKDNNGNDYYIKNDDKELKNFMKGL